MRYTCTKLFNLHGDTSLMVFLFMLRDTFSLLKWAYPMRSFSVWSNLQVSIKNKDASSIVAFICVYQFIFTALSSSCSVNEFDTAADNAFITCMTNVSCEAGCYRGYIFPNGQTNESYICQDGFWTPVILTCKRNYLGFLLHILSQNQSPFKIRLIFLDMF